MEKENIIEKGKVNINNISFLSVSSLSFRCVWLVDGGGSGCRTEVLMDRETLE